MNNKVIIVAGLVIFVALATFPFWYVLAGAEKVPPPDRSRSEDGPRCIEENMVARHMSLLDEWRDDVVRGDGGRQVHESDYFKKHHPDKDPYEKSLTRTCLDCHRISEDYNSAPSCAGCHDYANVRPACWDCHVEPKPKEN